MNTHSIQKRKWSAKLVALVTTAALIVTALAINVGSTLAAQGDINVTIPNESGISPAMTAEVGGTDIVLDVAGLFRAYSSTPSVADVIYTIGGNSNLANLRIRGYQAGVTGVGYGNKYGVLTITNVLVTDSRNISAYTIKDGGEVYFAGANVTKNAPVTVTAGNANTIAWRSMNTDVATVSSTTGAITSRGVGATVIIGEFTDKYGVKRDMHLIVGVGVKLSDSDLAELIELIKRAENILEHDSDLYTADSLAPLGPAKDAGKAVVNSQSPTPQQIQTAITNLRNALNGLVPKTVTGGGVIGPDPNGNYYKPVGDPEKVYEIVNQDGSSKYSPPRYVWNPTGDPVNNWQNNRPAYPYSGGYWVEDPIGSNIYKRVNSNGTLRDSPAIWGGPDQTFGTADDREAIKFGDGAYWIHMGQNVWRKLTPPLTLGPLTGGGPSEDPVATPGLPIYTHTDGKYFIGPLGPDGDGNTYYYGDSLTNGDGKLNSTASTKHPTDDKFYLVDGQMTTTPPSKEPDLTVPPGGTVVIDGIEWIKVKDGQTPNYVKYSMLIMKGVIDPSKTVKYADTFNWSQSYSTSNVRSVINGWYTYTPMPKLKSIALVPQLTASGPNVTHGVKAGSNTTDIAYCPFQSDVFPSLSTGQLNNGYRWWTQTKTQDYGSWEGFFVVLHHNGTWSMALYDDVYEPIGCYARPVIFVERP